MPIQNANPQIGSASQNTIGSCTVATSTAAAPVSAIHRPGRRRRPRYRADGTPASVFAENTNDTAIALSPTSSWPITAANTNTADPPRVVMPRQTRIAAAARVGRWRWRCVRVEATSLVSRMNGSGNKCSPASTRNNKSVPETSIRIAISGALIVPTTGPITATSPTFSSSPNTSDQAIHVISPSEMPLTNRKPTSSENHGVSAEAAFDSRPSASAITITRRRGRSSLPAPHEVSMKPANWAVEMTATVDTATCWSTATPSTRNGVAAKTTVLTAVAPSTPAGIFGLSANSSRTGACSIG